MLSSGACRPASRAQTGSGEPVTQNPALSATTSSSGLSVRGRTARSGSVRVSVSGVVPLEAGFEFLGVQFDHDWAPVRARVRVLAVVETVEQVQNRPLGQ